MIPVPEEIRICAYCTKWDSIDSECNENWICTRPLRPHFKLRPEIVSYAQAAYEQGRKEFAEELRIRLSKETITILSELKINLDAIKKKAG